MDAKVSRFFFSNSDRLKHIRTHTHSDMHATVSVISSDPVCSSKFVRDPTAKCLSFLCHLTLIK